MLDRLIEEGEFEAFPDAVRSAVALKVAGYRLTLNVAAMLRRFSLFDGRTLLSIFNADLSGIDVPRGKPESRVVPARRKALDIPPVQCLVVEDAPASAPREPR